GVVAAGDPGRQRRRRGGHDRVQHPGTDVHTILPQSVLPKLTGPTVIDGYTQPGSRPNTAGPGVATNALQTIVLDGTQAPGYGIRGLVFTGGNSTLRGMFVRNFTSNAVEMWGGGNVAEGNTVWGPIYVV